MFSGNNGIHGGAMVLQSDSTIYMMPHTHIEITHNHEPKEEVVSILMIKLQQQQFHVSFKYWICNVPIQLLKPYIENNTADEAGSTVYGGRLTSIIFILAVSSLYTHKSTVFSMIFLKSLTIV